LTIKPGFKRLAWGIGYALMGVLGMYMYLQGLHLAQDHAALHQLVQIELARQQQAAAPQPQPLPPAPASKPPTETPPTKSK
jgi:hypothetical protein